MYEKGRVEEFGGKNLHSIYITESYWETEAAAGKLYSSLMGAEARGMGKTRRFITNFHMFFQMTCVDIGKDGSEKLISEIEKAFKMPFIINQQYSSVFRLNTKQLFYLLDLWSKYSIQIQQSPIMDIIKRSGIVGDVEI